jgi:hypothetical protein
MLLASVQVGRLMTTVVLSKELCANNSVEGSSIPFTPAL